MTTHINFCWFVYVKALIQAEIKAQAQDSKADDRATEADDKAADKRHVVQL